MTLPTFHQPSKIGGLLPALRDLDGRLVAIEPLLNEKVVNSLSKTGEMQERITANVVVLDGGILQFGGNPTGAGNQPPTPHTHQITVPVMFENMFLSQQNVVAALRSKVGQGVVLARVQRGITSKPGQSPPWNINGDITPADTQLATQFYSARITGAFVNPDPIPLGPVQPAAPPQYAPAPVLQQAAPVMAPPPPGWDPAMWMAMTEDQRRQVLGVPAQPSNPF